MAARVSAEIPPHLNFASRDTIEDSINSMSESCSLEEYRDWDYNGLRLLPRKVRAELVDGLRHQSVLRALIPRLSAYRDMLRATNSSFDRLVASEQQGSLYSDDFLAPNRDYINNITSNIQRDMQVRSTP